MAGPTGQIAVTGDGSLTASLLASRSDWLALDSYDPGTLYLWFAGSPGSVTGTGTLTIRLLDSYSDWLALGSYDPDTLYLWFAG
jgi:hypothetical protein